MGRRGGDAQAGAGGEGDMSDDGGFSVGGAIIVRTIKPWPIKLSFEGVGELHPCPDITPLEAAHLAMLLVAASAQRGHFVTIDFAGFVAENKLERHFKKGEREV